MQFQASESGAERFYSNRLRNFMDLLYKDKRVPIPIIYTSVTAVNERKLATETVTPLRSYITVYYFKLIRMSGSRRIDYFLSFCMF